MKTLYVFVKKTVSFGSKQGIFRPKSLYLWDRITVCSKPKHCIFWTNSLKGILFMEGFVKGRHYPKKKPAKRNNVPPRGQKCATVAGCAF